MKMKTILATTLAIATLCSSAMIAMAADTGASESATVTTATTELATARTKGQRSDRYEKLLTDGTISQETYDKIKAYLAENAPQKDDTAAPKDKTTDKVNMLDSLLAAKIITQSDYDALKAAMTTASESTKTKDKVKSENRFSGFVTDGVISQETADAIKTYMEANRPSKPQGTEVKQRIDKLAKMLEVGVITQSEYDAIKAAMPERSAATK